MTEFNKQLVEDTTGPNAPDIETTDENLSAEALFQQSLLPSLGRQIFSVVNMHGPTAAIFNVKKKAASDDVELVRRNVECYPTSSIGTSITYEAIQDLRSQFGKDGEQLVGNLLRGLANDQENTATLAFLAANAADYGTLQLTDSLNSQTNLFEITQRVSEIVLQMNSKNLRTYEACCVLPYKNAAAIMTLGEYAGGDNDDSKGLYIGRVGLTKYYMNPDPNASVAYVVLKDSENASKSSAVFGKFASNVSEAINPDTGEPSYFIFNRFAIAASPLHEAGNEMIYKFTILL